MRSYARLPCQKQILAECRSAIELKADLKELIFATTAPDDTRTTDAAIEIERELLAEGRILRVVVYGWGNLQTLIKIHDVAYAAFCPNVVSTSAPATLAPETVAQIAMQVVEEMRQTTSPTIPRELDAAGRAGEDVALHAQIGLYRDLFKDEKEAHLAETGLRKLLEKEKERLDDQPRARFRILTNLGSIAFELGREAEGASRFEEVESVHTAPAVNGRRAGYSPNPRPSPK